MAERRAGHLQKYEAGAEGLHGGGARQSHHDIIGFREVWDTHAAACDLADLCSLTPSRPDTQMIGSTHRC